MTDKDVEDLHRKIIEAVESFGVNVGPPHRIYSPKGKGLRAYVEREKVLNYSKPEKHRSIDFRVILEDESVE